MSTCTATRPPASERLRSIIVTEAEARGITLPDELQRLLERPATMRVQHLEVAAHALGVPVVDLMIRLDD